MLKLLRNSFIIPSSPKLYCGGGGSPKAPPPPPPPPPPPQLAKSPDASAVRAEAGQQNIGGGREGAGSTLLTPLSGDDDLTKLSKKTLLGG